jgi:hypothetical protein
MELSISDRWSTLPAATHIKEAIAEVERSLAVLVCGQQGFWHGHMWKG